MLQEVLEQHPLKEAEEAEEGAGFQRDHDPILQSIRRQHSQQNIFDPQAAWCLVQLGQTLKSSQIPSLQQLNKTSPCRWHHLAHFAQAGDALRWTLRMLSPSNLKGLGVSAADFWH